MLPEPFAGGKTRNWARPPPERAAPKRLRQKETPSFSRRRSLNGLRGEAQLKLWLLLPRLAGTILLGCGEGLLQADHVLARAEGVEGLRFALELFFVVVRGFD